VAITDSLNNLVRIFVAPARAFDNLHEKPSIWFPLLLLIGAWIALWYWYYGAVDYPWLLDHIIAKETAKAPPDQHASIADRIRHLKPGAFVILSSLFVAVLVTVISALIAGYLNIVSAIVDDRHRFRNWFSLVLWCTLPSLVAIVAMIVHFFMVGDSHVAPENLNPLSFGSLLGIPTTNPYATLLQSIDLTSLWTWTLLVAGYRRWTKRSWLQSALAPLTMAIGIYGVWALIVWY